METVPLSDAKARLSEIADGVHRTHERVQITRNGRSYVVLIAADDLEALEATIELLSDPGAMARVRQAQVDLDQGEGVTGDEMAALMDRRRRPSSGG